MENKYTLKSIRLTPQIGNALKQIRFANGVKAVELLDVIGRKSSYITKIENAEIKNIKSDELIKLCNYISKSDEGLIKLINQLLPDYNGLTDETKASMRNVDDFLIIHIVSKSHISELQSYVQVHGISSKSIAEFINEKYSQHSNNQSEGFPINQWYTSSKKVTNLDIVYYISEDYIESILSSSEDVIVHIAIIRQILTAALCIGESLSHKMVASGRAREILVKWGVKQHWEYKLSTRTIPSSDWRSLLDSDTAANMDTICNVLAGYTNVNREKGRDAISQIAKTLNTDKGFAVSYMSIDLSPIKDKTRETKQKFLNEIRQLIRDYSEEQAPEYELYD